jgi:hypothetical protein
MTESNKKKLTKIASFACVLHCLIAPMLVIISPSLGHLFHNPIIETSIFLISLVFGMAIIYNGYCTHKKYHAALLFFIGACFWLANTIMELFFHAHFHIEFLLIGALFVLVSYKINHDHRNPCCTHAGSKKNQSNKN